MLHNSISSFEEFLRSYNGVFRFKFVEEVIHLSSVEITSLVSKESTFEVVTVDVEVTKKVLDIIAEEDVERVEESSSKVRVWVGWL